MNKQEIARMAIQAGIGDKTEPSKVVIYNMKELEAFAKIVASHATSKEREACAEVCKKHADVYAKLEGNPTAKSAWAACIDNRDAIRARWEL
jgi:hypothetical protein